ncbi:hypothetical protein [Haloquadratum walsbyi]|jgi:hypothetical protein|uniref:Uncharacterized protein n=1 Tax=Haloquadratum walsbyi (strain DSM 16854 / JCM 12705 / C23) TaxID=768065 RepID=G0LJN5_HALWC|nr:hypothetical protein [Haloquadratum walsbyi]CCC40969.1 uncharacterized protein Hqrw_3186 [Haloquadratum walsbyi C23]
MNARILKAYINHFIPREVIGPVIIVFSLEGVIDGIFTLYVPAEFATLGWGIIFLFAIGIVTVWGTTDEQDIEELQEQIEKIEDT